MDDFIQKKEKKISNRRWFSEQDKYKTENHRNMAIRWNDWMSLHNVPIVLPFFLSCRQLA